MSERPADRAALARRLGSAIDVDGVRYVRLISALDALEAAERERDAYRDRESKVTNVERQRQEVRAVAAEARVVQLEAQLDATRDVIHAANRLIFDPAVRTSDAIDDLRTELRVLAEVNARAAAVSVADSGPAEVVAFDRAGVSFDAQRVSGPEEAHPDWIGGCPVYGRERGTAGCERCGGDIITCPVYGEGERKRREEDAARAVSGQETT